MTSTGIIHQQRDAMENSPVIAVYVEAITLENIFCNIISIIIYGVMHIWISQTSLKNVIWYVNSRNLSLSFSQTPSLQRICPEVSILKDNVENYEFYESLV